MGAGLEERYRDLLYQLGQAACARLPAAPSIAAELRTYPTVAAAVAALEDRRLELATVEAEIAEAERVLDDCRQRFRLESEKLISVVRRSKKVIARLEAQLDLLARQREARERAAEQALKLERECASKIEAGGRSSGERERARLKSLKMDRLKADRALAEVEERRAGLFDPPSGLEGADAIRARGRLEFIEHQLAAREREHREQMRDLGRQLAGKEDEVREAQGRCDLALELLGAEAFQIRLQHPDLERYYHRLEPLVAELQKDQD
jgi:hypothetical protein